MAEQHELNDRDCKSRSPVMKSAEKMNEFILPSSNFLPTFLHHLNLREPTFKQFRNDVTHEHVCELSILCPDGNGNEKLQVFTGRSMVDVSIAKHNASLLLLHYLRTVLDFSVFDTKYEEASKLQSSISSQNMSKDSFVIDGFDTKYEASKLQSSISSQNMSKDSFLIDGFDVESFFADLPLEDIEDIPCLDFNPKISLAAYQELETKVRENLAEYEALQMRVQELQQETEKLSDKLLKSENKLIIVQENEEKLFKLASDFTRSFTNIAIHKSDSTEYLSTTAPYNLRARTSTLKKGKLSTKTVRH